MSKLEPVSLTFDWHGSLAALLGLTVAMEHHCQFPPAVNFCHTKSPEFNTPYIAVTFSTETSQGSEKLSKRLHSLIYGAARVSSSFVRPRSA